jgi:hypothetical protein
MNNFIFDLVTEEGFWGISDYSFKSKLEEYKDIINVKVNNAQELTDYLEGWIKEHHFSNIENTVFNYDLEKSYIIKRAIYTVDNKYYEILYYSDPYNGCELEEGPTEVEPIKKVIISYIKK